MNHFINVEFIFKIRWLVQEKRLFKRSLTEEVAAGLASLGLVVNLMIDILEDALFSGPWARDPELGCSGGLGLGLSVNYLDTSLSDHLFAEELVLPESDWVMLRLVELDFLGGAILLGIRISH